MDGLGNEMNIACDKTETVLKECLINGSCGNVAAVITRCNFITGGEKHYCLVNGNYFEDITGNKRSTLKGCFGISVNATVESVCFGYCQFWHVREKKIYKPTSVVTYSAIRRSNFCGDTTLTPFQ